MADDPVIEARLTVQNVKPFWPELGKMLTRPHRLVLVFVVVLLVHSGMKACEAEPLKVYEMTLDASKWLLGIIGAIARGPEFLKILAALKPAAK